MIDELVKVKSCKINKLDIICSSCGVLKVVVPLPVRGKGKDGDDDDDDDESDTLIFHEGSLELWKAVTTLVLVLSPSAKQY